MIISTVAIRRAATVLTFVAAITVFGVYAYIVLPREAAPDVPIPFVFVTTTNTGVAPEDIESAITVPIESKLKGISGVKKIRSLSREGASLISVEFEPDVDIEDALQKVRDKVDQAKGDLPSDADEPVISEFNVAEWPIMFINISGDVGLVVLKQVADDLKDRIEAIQGVLSAEVMGGLEREIRVEIDPNRLASYQLPLPDLLQLVRNENANISGGSFDLGEGKYQVRVPAEFQDPLELAALSIRTDGGQPIYLMDVGRIVDTHKDRATYARFNGRETVTVVVRKRVGYNIVRIADQVKRMLAEQRVAFPRGVSADITLDTSDFIRQTVDDLENNILTALIFVIGVIMVFMGLRNSLFVAIAIPLSMLIGFFVLLLGGITLNMVVLFSLILALGMLVDNAIVIVENIYRHMQEGRPRLEAAIGGTSQVAWPIITSTFTTVAAFLPLLFWTGIVGRFMRYLPLTVIIILLASLLVALVVNPTVCSRLMRAKPRATQRRHRILDTYGASLRAALRHPVLCILLPALFLVVIGAAYARFGAGVEFFPEVEPRTAIVNLRAPVGTNLDATNELARKVETIVGELPDVKYVVTNVGSAGGMSFELENAGPHLANVNIQFVERSKRTQSSRKTIEILRERLRDFVGAEVEVQLERRGPPTGAPVNVEISGQDFKVLAEIAHQVKQVVASVPGVVDVRDDFVETRPELQFQVDRNRAALLGLNTRYVADFLKMAVQGVAVDTFWEGNEERDITVRVAEPWRSDPVALTQLYVPDLRGNQIPLSALARADFGSGLGAINRINQDRVITVRSNVKEGYLAAALLKQIAQRLSAMPLPRGYRISYTGESKERDEASVFLVVAFAAAFMLVLLILVAQFNSIAIPAIVMFTVVLSIAGVLLGLLVTHKPFGVIMTGIGVISLAGVVVNNGIVLIDYIEKLLRRGLGIEAALVEAGMTRLRPVMLTAITTILGVLPMAIGVSINVKEIPCRILQKFAATSTFCTAATSLAARLGIDLSASKPIIDIGSENAQWWGPMAVAVVFGLGFATILTLVVVPALYLLIYRLRVRFGLGSAEGATGQPSGPADTN